MAELKWDRASAEEWDAIPSTPKKSKESPYDEIVNALVDGEIVSLTIGDEKELRGTRIGLSRRASSTNGVKLAFRYDEAKHKLVVRLKGEMEKPAVSTGEKRKPGRPRKA